MPMYRTVKCSVCGFAHTTTGGEGFKDWMLVQGIILDGDPEVWICPEHRNMIADYIDELKNGIEQ